MASAIFSATLGLMKSILLLILPGLAFLLAPGCGSSSGPIGFNNDGGGGGSGGSGGGDSGPHLVDSSHGDAPNLLTDSSKKGDTGGTTTGGPTTCAEAAMQKSYIGCDYWPTVTANSVWSIFDYTAVVANPQTTTANVTVTGPASYTFSTTVAPNSLTKIYLPWVPALKGQDGDNCGSFTALTASITAVASAYHLVASIPVTVYQFNALEYAGMGGPTGKSWASCPGNTVCEEDGAPIGCFSYTNDASLLLPSTAMTGNYRIATEHGWSLASEGSYFAVTATQDGTTVTIGVSATGSVLAGPGIAATGPGSSLSVGLNAGDVVEILGAPDDSTDLSGSLVHADKPVQVIAGMQCADEPLYPGDEDPAQACDHLESSVLPAETLGKDYVVTVPTSPNGAVIGAKVRFYGNVDGTTLTYSPSMPPGCPTSLDAGQVVECTGTASCPYMGDLGTETANCVTDSFEVTGPNEFAVTTFMLGGTIQDPSASIEMQLGDPSMSPMVTTAQYRTHYIFLAPTDYVQSYADVVESAGDTLTLDGAAVTTAATPLNSSWSIVRIPLTAGADGTHVLTGTKPFGVQVIGYGNYTSYQYPAGLDLVEISMPPPPPPPPK
jgi:hypothetical protein